MFPALKGDRMDSHIPFSNFCVSPAFSFSGEKGVVSLGSKIAIMHFIRLVK